MNKRRALQKNSGTANPQIKQDDKIYIGNAIKGPSLKKRKSLTDGCGCGSSVKKLRSRKP